MCLSLNCHKEDRQEDIYNDVHAASGSSEDSRCLLDAICRASTGPGVSADFMIFRSTLLGACCCQVPTREGSCDSLDTCRPFLLRLSIHGCHLMT